MSRRPRNASGNSSTVHMSDADLAEFMEGLHGDVDKVLEALAGLVADRAKAEPFPTSKKGILVKRLKPRKSRFDDGGWIVQDTAPHAHLVEYGHAMVTHDGRTVGHVAAHPFLRQAKNSVKARLGAILEGLWK